MRHFISGLGLGLEALGLEAFGLETPGLVNIPACETKNFQFLGLCPQIP